MYEDYNEWNQFIVSRLVAENLIINYQDILLGAFIKLLFSFHIISKPQKTFLLLNLMMIGVTVERVYQETGELQINI